MIETQQFAGASKSNTSFLTPFERRLAVRDVENRFRDRLPRQRLRRPEADADLLPAPQRHDDPRLGDDWVREVAIDSVGEGAEERNREGDLDQPRRGGGHAPKSSRGAERRFRAEN